MLLLGNAAIKTDSVRYFPLWRKSYDGSKKTLRKCQYVLQRVVVWFFLAILECFL